MVPLLSQCNSSSKTTYARTDDQDAEAICIFECFERHLVTDGALDCYNFLNGYSPSSAWLKPIYTAAITSGSVGCPSRDARSKLRGGRWNMRSEDSFGSTSGRKAAGNEIGVYEFVHQQETNPFIPFLR